MNMIGIDQNNRQENSKVVMKLMSLMRDLTQTSIALSW